MNVYSDNEHLVHVTFNSDKQESLVFRLFDMRGRLVVQEQVVSSEGLNHMVLNIRPVADASYIMTITGSEFSESKKFFLQ